MAQVGFRLFSHDQEHPPGPDALPQDLARAKPYSSAVLGGAFPAELAWPLVGREPELARIAADREEGYRGVVIAAPAGAGKSRLGREALAVAGHDGALTEWVQATDSAAMVPLGAFAALLPKGIRSEQMFTLLRAISRSLGERAAGRAIVLGVDDAQLLDPVSAALVLQLASTGDAFVIATVRTGEPCPDAIVSLWKDAGADRVELEALSDDAVRRLIEGALDGPVEEEVVRWVIDRSRGNPLYARELVRGALAAGTLTRGRGIWTLSGPLAVAESLLELVGRRIAALPGEELAPLELLALAEPLTMPELAGLTSHAAVAAVEAQGLITVRSGADGDDVRLGHPLYGDVVRTRIPPARGISLRLELARTLQQRRRPTSDNALRVIRLLLDAGAPIPSSLLIDGARAANLAGDPDLAGQLAERAVADGAGLPAALALARARVTRERFDEAEAVLAGVETEASGHPLGIDYLEQRTRVLFWGLGRVKEMRALLDRARSWSDEPMWPSRLLAVGMPSAVADDLPRAIAAVQGALGAPALDGETRRLLEPRYSLALFYAGRWGQAQAVARRLRPQIPVRDYPDLVTLAAIRLAGVESGADWPQLESDLARWLANGVRRHDHEAAGQGALGLGQLAFLRGRFRDAERWLAEAELHFERDDAFLAIAEALVCGVGTACYLGDTEGAASTLDRLKTINDTTRPRPLSRPAYLLRAEGWVACARDRARGAAQLLSAAEEFLDGMPGFAVLLAYDALLAGASAATVGAIVAPAAARCDGPLIDAYDAHADALTVGDPDALSEVAERFAGIGALRYAMVAATQAAAIHLEAGDPDSAHRAADRARGLHQSGHGTDAPEIEGLAGSAPALTARETQLVEFAREGLTNAEIADRLGVSVRTVETHLYRAMHKLGVHDRRAL